VPSETDKDPYRSISHRGTALDQIPWTDFFSQELYLPYSEANQELTYHAYLSPPSKSGPLFVMHHGAGSSGLSFAVCSAEIRKSLPEAGVLSIDARGHGDTIIKSSREAGTSIDMSLKTLSQDLVSVINLVKEKLAWSKLPGLVLVGHSLGGAVITEVAKGGALGNDLLAYAVLDVVEGKC
jgi:protein phosphatase methylesterase 1